MMKLEKIYVHSHWGKDGEYHGSVTFAGEDGKVELKLTPKHIDTILDLMADALVSSAKEVASNLTTEAIATVKSLAKKTEH